MSARRWTVKVDGLPVGHARRLRDGWWGFESDGRQRLNPVDGLTWPRLEALLEAVGRAAGAKSRTVAT